MIKALRFRKADLTKLENALYNQNVRTIKSFLDRGWNPKNPIDGSNPLNLAGGVEVVRLLVEAGADIDASFGYFSPLSIHAGTKGGEPVVDYLLKMGANPNWAYSGDRYDDIPAGTTPLMKASNHGYLSIAKLLLASRADVNAVDQDGHNALFHALRGNETETAKELLKRGSKLTDDILGPPVLNGNLEIIRLLLAKGANVSYVYRRRKGETGPDKETLLGHAIAHVGISDYPLAIIELLIKGGADVNAPSNWWVFRESRGKGFAGFEPVPPLRIAGNRGLENVMDMLWKAGAKGSLKEALEGCSLDKACFRGSTEMVKLLIKAGHDVNAPGHEGKRPIEFARLGRFPEIVELLKKAGAKD